MSISLPFSCRIAATVLGVSAALIGGATNAAANPGPGCTAGDITGVETQVAGAMTGYFFTHPPVNDFFSSLQALPREEAFGRAKAYLDANPQTDAEIKAIRGPVLELRQRCDIPANSLIRGVL